MMETETIYCMLMQEKTSRAYIWMWDEFQNILTLLLYGMKKRNDVIHSGKFHKKF